MKIYYNGEHKVTYDGKWVPRANEYIWLSNGASFGDIGVTPTVLTDANSTSDHQSIPLRASKVDIAGLLSLLRAHLHAQICDSV